MKQNVIVCPLQEIRDYYGKSELLSNEYYVRIAFMFIGNCTNLKWNVRLMNMIYVHAEFTGKDPWSACEK